jgi:hypothetical protein
MSEIIGSTIRRLRDEFLRTNGVPSYFEINNGLCDEFAIMVVLQLGSPANLYDVEGGNFQTDDGGWDWPLLDKFWGIAPPEGLSAEEMDTIDVGGHVFVADHSERRFYDAECPEGVSSFFELPLYRRSVIHALRLKGIPTDEVLPEDVVPPPKCPVSNPVVSRPPESLSEGVFSI